VNSGFGGHPPGSARSRAHALAARGFAAVVVAVALTAYLPSLDGPFFTDDYLYVASNPTLQSTPLSRPWEFLLRRTNPLEYLPLRDLSLRVDYALFGDDARGYHAHNLLLYALACAFFWLLARELARLALRPCGRGSPGRDEEEAGQVEWVAAVALALFAAHPAHVESVAWIAGRKDLLSGVFVLASAWVFSRGVTLGNSGPARTAAALLLFVGALLSKGTALPLGAVVFFLLLAFHAEPGGARGRVRSALIGALPYLSAAAAAFVLYLAVGAETGVLRAPPVVGDAESLQRGPLAPLLILGWLLRISLFPTRLRLIYDIAAPGPERLLALLLGVGALAVTIWACAILLRRRSPSAFAWMWFALFSSLFLQVIPFNTWSLVSERFLFLPLGGLALLAGLGAVRLPRRLAVPGVVVLTGALLLGTASRSREWSSAERLVAANVEASPRRSLSVELFIDEVLKRGAFEEALRAASRVEPEVRAEVLSTYVRARAALAANAPEGARPLVVTLLAATEGEVSTFRLQLANLALEVGLPEEAAEVLEAWLERRPGHIAIHYNLGLAQKQAGHTAEAAATIQAAIDAGLSAGAAFNNLGLLYRDLGRTQDAERTFEEGISRDTTEWQAAYNFARLLVADGRTTEAGEVLRLARRRAVAAGANPAPVDALIRSLPPGARP